MSRNPDAAAAQLMKLGADLERAGDHAAYEAPRLVAMFAAVVAEKGRARAHKVSGELADSIWETVDLVMATAEIGPYAFYGHFVEYGTDHAPPYPFMGPGLDEVEPEFVAAMAKLGGDIL